MAIRVGVIGYGYWGPNLVRNFNKFDGYEMVAVSDIDRRKLNPIKKIYPKLEVTTNTKEVLHRPDIDAVAIATPISTHHELAKMALCEGKHVLVEKPLTRTVSEASELIELAEKNKRILMVDHTFVYTGVVRKIKEIINSGEIGDIYYFDSVRVNLGLFQHDVNVVWDLAPHDFSIMNFLIDKDPTSISAIGARHIDYTDKGLESMAYITIKFEDECIAHFHLNWLSPVKIRRTIIGGSKRMIIYDHLDPDNQVKVFNKGVEVKTSEERDKVLVQYRTGDMYAPKVDQTEALEVLCKHFMECIQNNRRPITDGNAGLNVVKLLQAAERSMKNKGEVVKI